MEKRFWLFTGMMALFLASSACAGPSRLELDFGTSAKLSKFNQIHNPEAGKNPEPVTGFDGEAAQATMDRYQKDFEKPAPPPTYMMTIGGITSK